MMDDIKKLAELMERISEMHLSAESDERLHELMARSNEGQLDIVERAELEALVEWSETLSLARAKALQCLGRKP